MSRFPGGRANKVTSIRDILQNAYRRLGLYPLLGIQLVLIAVFLVVMNLAGTASRRLVLKNVQSEMQSIAQMKANRIDAATGNIYCASELLRQQYARLFSDEFVGSLPKPDAQFAVAPNGVTYKTNDNGGSYIWYSARTPQGVEQLKKRRITESVDPFAKSLMTIDPSIVAVYFNSYDSMCRYYPYQKDIWKWEGYTPNMRIPDYNFYYMADAKHNPSRKPVWTKAYLDPAGKGWLVSCISPVYRGNFLEGVTGIDVTINEIIQNLFNDVLPYGTQSMLVDSRGTIIAMPDNIARWLNMKELTGHNYSMPILGTVLKPSQYNLIDKARPEVLSAFRPVLLNDRDINTASIFGKNFVIASSTVPNTGWRVVTMAERDLIYQPMVDVEELAKYLGVIAFLVAMLLTVAVSWLLAVRSTQLAHLISAPIEGLVSASSAITHGQMAPEVVSSDIKELDALTTNFAHMARVLENDAKRKQLYTARLKLVHDITSDPELAFEMKQRQLLQMLMHETHLKSVTLVHQQAVGLETICAVGNVRWLDGSYISLDGQTRSDDVDVRNCVMKCTCDSDAQSHTMMWVPFTVDGLVTGGIACELAENYYEADDISMEILQMVAQWFGYERERQEAEARRQQLMANLQTANRELSEFAYVASHDLKAPLRSLNSLTDWLAKDYTDVLDEHGKEILDLLVDKVHRMQVLVEGVLSFARVEHTRSRIEIVDINALVHELFVSLNFNDKHKLEVPVTLPKVNASQSSLKQVFRNLLENAIRHMDPMPGVVVVTYRDAGEMHEFAISDSGPDIDPNLKDQVFDVIQAAPLGDESEGTGIGLAQVKKIIEICGGEVWLDSSPDKGTTFTFKFPKNQPDTTVNG